MVDGIHHFLDVQIEDTQQKRKDFWEKLLTRPDISQDEARAGVLTSLEELRQRLRHICGIRDNLVPHPEIFLRAKVGGSSLVASSATVEIHQVWWPAFDDVTGEGLLLMPRGREAAANVVAIPDADQTPEWICGLAEGSSPQEAWALRLAEAGCRVLVPMLISRKVQPLYRVKLSQREYVYRPAYELGRHILGYEAQKILAGLAALGRMNARGKDQRAGPAEIPSLVIGYGEGGQLALLVGAVCGGEGFRWPGPAPQPAWPATNWCIPTDGAKQPEGQLVRLQAVVCSGFFGPREVMWREPVDRNIFGFLRHFGAAELVALAAPAQVIIESAPCPNVAIPPGLGGAPGVIESPQPEAVHQEFLRALKLTLALKPYLETAVQPELVPADGTPEAPFGRTFLQKLAEKVPLSTEAALAVPAQMQVVHPSDPFPRECRQLHELERHNQFLLEESRFVRQTRFPLVDTGAPRKISLEEYQKLVEKEREWFYREVIGRLDVPLADPQARSRRWKETDSWVGYEVVLDVFPPSVFAYGILLVPKDLKPGERRPVVVCQHGLEGRPQETIEGDHRAYHDFASRLAQRGFIVFAPQNPYIFGDRFRSLQRKLNPLGCTLFSVIIPQHAQILAWLRQLPFVDGSRIGFYGLSYGGKTAMRVPAVLTDYCLSICSADFNEWVWKNAAINTRGRYSYVFTIEYEIFEFDLGSTFNYAEMAALIAPRPFMVERGHYDGVAPDETVAYEFAKVRYLYAATLGIPERCSIEWFVGPHTIHGQGTFEFLRRFLNWPKPD
jgi:dienelactone hydrolase